MENYATTDDLIARWRSLTSAEITQANILLGDASNALRLYAEDRGLDLDQMVAESQARRAVAEAVVCDIVRREMNSNTDNSPAMSQMTQSAGGYSLSGTFLSAGGGLFVKNAELKQLGLMKQRAKAVDLYGTD